MAESSKRVMEVLMQEQKAEIIYYNFMENKKGFVDPVLSTQPKKTYPMESAGEKLFWHRATVLFNAWQEAKHKDMENLWKWKLFELMKLLPRREY